MIDTAQALASLRPNAEWSMNGDDIEGIIWHTPNVEPLTTAEVQAEMVRLEAEELAVVSAKQAARESALAKLAALGLTEEEAQSLIQ
jgi:hypothetical protein